MVRVEIWNPSAPDRLEAVEFLVDSGAIYSVVPKPILDRLGIRPHSAENFRLAYGEMTSRQKGIALFKYEGKVGGADVIFGEPGDSRLLGAFMLEALGLALDPLKRELKPLPMIPGGCLPPAGG